VRILVIGGSGFIGPFVAAELAHAGHEIAIFHRGHRAPLPYRAIVGDRRQLAASAGAIRSFAPEVVVDLVLSSERQARDLLEVVRGVAARIVAVSSMDVYRACGVLHRLEPGPLEPLPLTEASPLRTSTQTYPPEQIAALQHLFGWVDRGEYDKIPVERVLLAERDAAVTVLRLPIVYGPGDALHRLYPLVKRIDDGRRAIIVPVARWRATRGYVEDVAGAIAAAATHGAGGQIYNVGEPDVLDELGWAQLVADCTGWTGELIELTEEQTPPHLRQPGNMEQHWIADTSRLRRELGYAERVTRREAVERTIAWQRTAAPQLPIYRFDYPAEDAAVAQAMSDLR